MTTVIFSHGQESGPWGTKIRAMADLVRGMGCKVLNDAPAFGCQLAKSGDGFFGDCY